MKRFLTIVLIFTTCFQLFAQRPKVGLVLCGGGAKGAAHAGVLKVLEEYQIPVDYIVGTSMGAIVGGLHAIGYSGDDLDSLIMAQDWTTIMSDRVPRQDISFENKKYRENYILKIPFGRGAPKLPFRAHAGEDAPPEPGSILSNIPMALIGGQNIYNLFTRLSVGYQDSLDFDNMPIPYACVAVDLVGKKEVVFRNGNLVQAMRASMAIPGVFAPVRLNDMVLVDGGVRNNYPVDVAKAMGADIIIGVKLGIDSEKKEVSVNSIGDVFSEMLDMYMEDKYQAAIDMTDILITPSIKGYGTMSFDQPSLRVLIDNGEKAAREKDVELRRLKHLLDEKQKEEEENMVGPKYVRKSYRKAIHIDQDTIVLGHVSFNGLSLRDAEWLLGGSKLKSGASVTGKDIDKAISDFYSTSAFSSVTYILKGQESPYDMEINFTPGLRSQLGIGFRFDTEEIATILLNVSFNRLALYGSKYSLTAKVAYNNAIKANYSYAFRTQVQFNTGYSFKSSDLNLFNKGLRSDDISFINQAAYVSLSSRKFRSIYTELGMKYENFDYTSELSPSDVPSIYDPDTERNNFISAYVKATFDQLDKEYFPTRGIAFDAGYSYYFNWLTKDNYPFSAVNFHITGVASLSDRFALIPSLYHRTLIGGNIPVSYMNLMGGYEAGRYMEQQMPFMGFNYTYAFKNILSVASMDARVRIGNNHYITASASYSIDSEGFSDIFADAGILGVRLGYSYDFMIGPISFNLHWSDYTSRVGAYLSFGYSF
ncbi:MAG: patatin-like phospholipase family protein [Bacteroidales bacterium]|nr:patatin-like phospholipase family protein [Bacteroidales bacterium]MDD4671089.1 patatin-like phospholipase family protein [Bacteroidales bacterium]